MLIISEDPDGRFAFSTNSRLVIRETLDSNHISYLHFDNSDGSPQGWTIMKDSSMEKVKTKFKNLVDQWKVEHINTGFEVFDLTEKEVI